MAGLKYRKLPKHPSEMTDQELQDHLAHIPNSQGKRESCTATEWGAI